MKKIFLFTVVILSLISTNVYSNTTKEISEKQLIEIYTVALDSFVPKKEGINIYNKDYLAIDMSSTFFDSILQEGKQQILDYFKNKYNMEVMNASVDTLKEKGLASKYGTLKYNGKRGLLLFISDVKFKSESEAVINGSWYVSGVAGESYKSRIVLKNGKWILQERIWIGIS